MKYLLHIIAILLCCVPLHGQIDPYRKNILTTNFLTLGTNLYFTNGVLEASASPVTLPLTVANGGTGNDLSGGLSGVIPYFDFASGRFVTTGISYTNGIVFESTLGFLSVFRTNTTGDIMLNLQEGGASAPSIQGYSDKFVVANTNLTLDAVGPFSIRLRINGSNVLEAVAGSISLSGQTNLVADNGSFLTYNGNPIVGALAGTVLNSVASAGLLAVDASKTNGIAATLAHMTNALGFTGSTTTFLRSDGTQATPTDTWGPVGTMVGSGMTAAGVIPATTGTSGTNFVSSPFAVSSSTNVTLTGRLSANALTATNLTASRALVSDGASGLTNSTTTSVELGYVSGVTSAIQTQLDAKQSTTAPGSDTRIIYNDGGAFAAATNGTWNKTTRLATWDNLTVTTNLTTKNITATGTVTGQGNMNAGAGFSLGFTGRGHFFASSDGVWQLFNNNENAITSLQINRPNLNKTANYTILAADSGSVLCNVGAVATNRYDLPTATVGLEYGVVVDAAFNVQLQATGGAIIHDGAVASAVNGDIHSDVPYSVLQVRCHRANHWVVHYKSTGWTGPQ